MRRPGHLDQRLSRLRPMRMVTLRLSPGAEAQLGLPLALPSRALPTLDLRLRGAEFIGLKVRRIVAKPG